MYVYIKVLLNVQLMLMSAYFEICNTGNPVITQPTGVTNYTETVIDHIYTNVLNKPITSGICLTETSDHFLVFLILHKIKSAKKRNMKKRNFKNFNNDMFLQDLETSISDSNHNRNVNNSFSNFFSIFASTVNKHAPIQNVSRKEFKLSTKPSITPAILKSIKRKQYLYYHNFIKGNEDKKRYYTHLKELSKKLYLKNKITNIQGNIKETWKIINQIVKIRSKLWCSTEFKFRSTIISYLC